MSRQLTRMRRTQYQHESLIRLVYPNVCEVVTLFGTSQFWHICEFCFFLHSLSAHVSKCDGAAGHVEVSWQTSVFGTSLRWKDVCVCKPCSFGPVESPAEHNMVHCESQWGFSNIFFPCMWAYVANESCWVTGARWRGGGEFALFLQSLTYFQGERKADPDLFEHLGVRKTYDRILHRLFWPRMKKDVSTPIKTCSTSRLT